MKNYNNKLKKKLADQFFKKQVVFPETLKCISFTFDDVPKSGFVNGQSILDKYHKKGTFYISLSFMEGIEDNENLYTFSDLKKCVDMRHELACHTYGHVHFYELSSKQEIERQVLENNTILKTKGIDYDFSNFSYPFGEQTLISKKIVSKRFQTARGIDFGINASKVDLNNLKAIRLYEATNSIDKIKELLEEFNENRGWLIFYTHDVQENYTKYGCSPKYLESVLKKCLDLNIEVDCVKNIAEKLYKAI